MLTESHFKLVFIYHRKACATEMLIISHATTRMKFSAGDVSHQRQGEQKTQMQELQSTLSFKHMSCYHTPIEDYPTMHGQPSQEYKLIILKFS